MNKVMLQQMETLSICETLVTWTKRPFEPYYLIAGKNNTEMDESASAPEIGTESPIVSKMRKSEYDQI